MSATITDEGKRISVGGELPVAGQPAPAFTLVDSDLKNRSLAEFAGKRVVLNIFPSVDTPTCAMSVRHFNALASGLDNTVVLCISADLPFAQQRFCGAEGLSNVLTLSTMRGREFLHNYGVEITSGECEGLAARAVVIVDEKGTVIYTQLVAELADEPDYDAAVKALQR
ncbi:thiol peroxidase [Shimwellia blattae]|uniref:Thiol peroxidase n=1 Tax=Shimwellia blattae (strain ATCC 29907 / DSM 4481 / JCM 1650 / NBRC 105725 / CDC 9005-74) TaxID=630626 RepID=I2B5E4_SHIBC|nr:thiol peroxidase [Shimwellia blattae]AFJ45748.1 thiol peroxidase [Shimwellia blattae DSM 4481 = NBRC 105725]GAB82196.1 putative thiol peroxidase [Shimwellia blattae DSM 4481 = NBRC 105725]VDY63232.1 Thiol peroxidase [Shimwellia blattae]VEC20927.1 Thiol peroxidase [Shimwellia blattae]